MAPKKTKKELKQTTSKVSTTDTNGTETETEEVMAETVYDQPTCNVGFTAGCTRNMGNYNNVKVSVSLFMPCYPAEVEETFEFVNDWVDGKMQSTIDSLDEV